MKDDIVSSLPRRKWDAATIRRELNRQRERASDRVFALDQEERLIRGEKARAAKRRPYIYKNNGKGRPRKIIKEFSQEKIRRRQLIGKDLVILEALLEYARTIEDVAEFQSFLIGLVAEERSKTNFDQMRLKKLLAFCHQFCGEVPNHFPLPWKEDQVKAFFEVLAKQATRILGLGEADPKQGSHITKDWPQARAEADLLDKFLKSGNLESDQEFVAALIVHRDHPSTQDVYRPQAWKPIWQDVLDQLYYRTAKVFAVRPAKPGAKLKPVGIKQTTQAAPFDGDASPDGILLDLDLIQETPWPQQHLVSDSSEERQKLEQLDGFRNRYADVMGSARKEAVNPLKTEGHLMAAIKFGETLVAALRALLHCRRDLLAATPKSKRVRMRQRFTASNRELLFWLRGWLDDMTILAKEFADYGKTDWAEEAKRRGVRYPENRSSWPPLHMQLSAAVSKAHIELTEALRELKP